MKRALDRRPADFVVAPLPDQRLGELWDGIERGEARVRRRGQYLRKAAASAALLSVAVFALLLARPVSLPPTLPETDAQLAPDAPGSESARQLSLSDGSTLYLSAGSRAQVVTMTQVEVRVRLDRGSVECEVQPVPERRFVVEAAGFEVVVKGTHFTVSLGGEQIIDGVSVSVERGSVEVREPPDRVLALLGPGQLWSSERNGASPEAVSPAVVSPP
ncbi:MAG: hypothetical protein RL033_602, partial [Pseudomonadota bacterium]